MNLKTSINTKTRKLSSIEDQGQTDRIHSWPWPVTFSDPHTCNGQRTVSSKWKQMDVQMDGGDCITSRTNGQ